MGEAKRRREKTIGEHIGLRPLDPSGGLKASPGPRGAIAFKRLRASSASTRVVARSQARSTAASPSAPAARSATRRGPSFRRGSASGYAIISPPPRNLHCPITDSRRMQQGCRHFQTPGWRWWASLSPAVCGLVGTRIGVAGRVSEEKLRAARIAMVPLRVGRRQKRRWLELYERVCRSSPQAWACRACRTGTACTGPPTRSRALFEFEQYVVLAERRRARRYQIASGGPSPSRRHTVREAGSLTLSPTPAPCLPGGFGDSVESPSAPVWARAAGRRYFDPRRGQRSVRSA
jgi:hypothetical protein